MLRLTSNVAGTHLVFFQIPFEDDTNSLGSGFAAFGDPGALQPDVSDVIHEIQLRVECVVSWNVAAELA